jgi:hypothetical protein
MQFAKLGLGKFVTTLSNGISNLNATHQHIQVPGA